MATVVVIGFGMVLSMAAVIGVLLGGAVAARHRAGAAADFAAIAAAEQPYDIGEACRAAARVATADGATIETCRLVAGVAEVRVRVALRGPFGALGPARATARAGQVPP